MEYAQNQYLTIGILSTTQPQRNKLFSDYYAIFFLVG
jgi:hypothetical protein